MIKKLSVILLLLIGVISSLLYREDQINSASTKEELCCFGSKIWRHRIKDIADYKKHVNNFSGFELDVVFLDSLNEFDLRHDLNGEYTGNSLLEFFDNASEDTSKYFWLDFKNLNSRTVDDASKRLLYLFGKYDLLGRVIVESWNPKELGELSDLGIKTSFWVPHFSLDTLSVAKVEEEVRFIKEVMYQYDINALSGHYKMLPFLKGYFSDCNIHIWTNGLSGTGDVEQINEFRSEEIVKVILVDYENCKYLSCHE